MSKRVGYTAIVPQTDWRGSLLFRFSPEDGLQCFADGCWYTITTGIPKEGSGSYTFQHPLHVDEHGTVFLDIADASATAANKVVTTGQDGLIPSELLPVLESADVWIDLT